MIVKDEEANLPTCLTSAADLVGEVVVIDTGSTDRSRDVARSFGARVFDFSWVDSFSAARNESLRHATGDWIFWLDADDRLDEMNRARLRSLFGGLGDEVAAYVMNYVSPWDAVGGATHVQQARLFRNHPQIRWQHRVHEQILPSVRALGGVVRWTDVVIMHAGYHEPAVRRRKLERNQRLLHLEDAEQPEQPFILFNLGAGYLELGEPARAVPLLLRSLARSHVTSSFTRKLYSLLAQAHHHLGQNAEALAACREGRGHFPDNVELLFVEAQMRKAQRDWAGAEACLLHLLVSREGPHFANVDAALQGSKGRHQLALLYREQGRLAEAEAQWQKAVTEQPLFLPAWLELGELYTAQQRWQALAETAQRLEERTPGTPEAAMLRERAHRGLRSGALGQAVVVSAHGIRSL
jgi:predicted Zn-dependent protease